MDVINRLRGVQLNQGATILVWKVECVALPPTLKKKIIRLDRHACHFLALSKVQ